MRYFLFVTCLTLALTLGCGGPETTTTPDTDNPCGENPCAPADATGEPDTGLVEVPIENGSTDPIEGAPDVVEDPVDKGTDGDKTGDPVDGDKTGDPVDGDKTGDPVDGDKTGDPVDGDKTGDPVDTAKPEAEDKPKWAGGKGLDGEKLYKKCKGCHGTSAEPKEPDLFAKKWSKRAKTKAFDIIENGKGKMPAFDKKLTDDEIAAIIRYVSK